MLRKKALFGLIALSFCQAMFAQPQECCLPAYRPGEPIACELPPGYMYSAEYALNPDLFISAEFLYWKVNKESRNSIGSTVLVAGTQTTTDLFFHDAGFDPGFKINAGFGLPSWDNWVACASYTWFHHTTTVNKTANVAVGEVIRGPVGITPVFSASAASSNYRFNIDFAEVNLGRPIYVNERLILSPFFGLKGFWINEKQTITYSIIGAAIPGVSVDSAKWWGVGPYGGMSLQGLLWKGVYVVGKVDLISPFVKFYNTRFTQDYVFGTTDSHTVTRRQKPYGNWPIAEANIGLGWGAYFGCNNHVDIVVSYDFVNSIPAAVPFNNFVPSEFYMQGITFKGQGNF